MRKCYKCKEYLQPEDSICEGLHQACFCAWFQLSTPEDFRDVVSRSSERIKSDWTRITSSFFHGKFRKYSA